VAAYCWERQVKVRRATVCSLSDLDQLCPGRLVQIVAGQAATGRGQQTEQILLDVAAGEQPFRFRLPEPLQATGVRGVGQWPMVSLSCSAAQLTNGPA
jgi:hypothetical protein